MRILKQVEKITEKKTENILITKDGDGEGLDAHEPPP